MWGGGCGESNSCTKLYILRARLYHFIFVCPISFFEVIHVAVWSAKQIGGFGEVCVGVVVRSCRCGEVCVCGEVCEVSVGRWVL